MNSKYYLSVVVAFTIWGLFSLVLKPLSAYSSVDILLYRMCLASIFILFVSFVVRWKITKANIILFKSFSFKERFDIVLTNLSSAGLLALNWFLFIYVMNHISVNATSLAYLICPILTTVLAFFILKENLSVKQKLAISISIVSCLMLSIGHLMDLVYSMIIALSYAIYLILQKRNNQLDKFFTLTAQIVFGSILLSPLFFTGNESSIEKSNLFYILVIVIAIVFTIIPMYLNVFALKKLNSSVVGIFININPILSFLLAVLYFHEKVNLVQGIAYTLIFFSVLLFNLDALQGNLKKRFIKST
ncbi:EamA family transporter [Moheibacter sediminis]|uniref:Chloramphenicol-sensitive protein RarD n=1 Tax=Moheibacter sediminis TaxID=1434700 RepID=A0A1W1Z1C6_9FLAO|nr:EamA family transporter [Moheibacter sediminis]SMC41758.1 chloramphenicol-sensitive protein RarD [Moheibacter sediminis]